MVNVKRVGEITGLSQPAANALTKKGSNATNPDGDSCPPAGRHPAPGRHRALKVTLKLFDFGPKNHRLSSRV